MYTFVVSYRCIAAEKNVKCQNVKNVNSEHRHAQAYK